MYLFPPLGLLEKTRVCLFLVPCRLEQLFSVGQGDRLKLVLGEKEVIIFPELHSRFFSMIAVQTFVQFGEFSCILKHRFDFSSCFLVIFI